MSQQSWATDLSWTPWVDKSKVAPALLPTVYHSNAELQTVYVPHPFCVCLNTRGRAVIAKGSPAHAWCIHHDCFASVPSTWHVCTQVIESRHLQIPKTCIKLECQAREGIQSWSSCMWSRPRRQWPVSSLSVHNTGTHTYTHYNDLTNSSIPTHSTVNAQHFLYPHFWKYGYKYPLMKVSIQWGWIWDLFTWHFILEELKCLGSGHLRSAITFAISVFLMSPSTTNVLYFQKKEKIQFCCLVTF